VRCARSAVPILATLVLSAVIGPAGAQHHQATRAVASDASFPSPFPVLRKINLMLTASVARLSLVPGTETQVFAYNGTVPGPTLEFREGDRVTVIFRNELPVPTTIHWHGLHLPYTSDGSPFHPVPPGDEYQYVFTIPPGTAGTYWYHPHPHHQTGQQVAKGLYGAIIVRAADDPLAALREQLLVLSDNRFLPDGSFDLPEAASHHGRVDFENGREGDVIFVSGAVTPTLTIRAGEVQRWRIVNASGARVYRLALEGHTFLHVGNDGGLFEKPVEVSEVLLATGERVEVLVRATGAPGSRAALRALPYDRYIPQTRPSNWSTPRDLLTVQYSSAPSQRPVRLPTTLRSIPLIDTTGVTTRRLMVLTQGMINGQLMDPDRVDVASTIGAVEIWEIENLVGMDHPFHLHGFQFQVLDRNGVPEPFRSWKDVVNVPKHGTARFIVRYDTYPGKWMFHCHILSHEDHGMMGILQVQRPGGDP
jgi:FtsP/CotA-like multicopper oxidase with cupredoxin domain